MRMVLCLVILTANVQTKKGLATTSLVLRLGVLIINKTKCVECLFYSKNTSFQSPFSFLNGEALSREHTIKYLGVYFSSNMAWSSHVETFFTFAGSFIENRFSLSYTCNLILLPDHFPWTA